MKITWTNETWNPAVGCSKVSPGCAHCYAERMAGRLRAMGLPEYQVVHDGRGWTGETVRVQKRLEQPLRWRTPRRVFVGSMTDLFHESVPFGFIATVFGVMAAAPQHTYQVLTKRPERMAEWSEWLDAFAMRRFGLRSERLGLLRQHAAKYVPKGRLPVDVHADGMDWPLPNVVLMTTAEDQQRADERIHHLLQCPAVERWVSCEPLLGPVDLVYSAYTGAGSVSAMEGIHGVIVGGESGPNARPMHPDWARGLRDQCAAAGVGFHFKQWGEWVPKSHTTKRHQWHIQQHPGDWPINVGYCPERWGALADDGSSCETGTCWNGHDDDGSGEAMMYRVGKKTAGRLLDGCEHNDMPGDLAGGER